MSTPSFCWHCGGKLAKDYRAASKGGVHFRTVVVDGASRVVHACCAATLQADAATPHLFEGARRVDPDQ